MRLLHPFTSFSGFAEDAKGKGWRCSMERDQRSTFPVEGRVESLRGMEGAVGCRKGYEMWKELWVGKTPLCYLLCTAERAWYLASSTMVRI